MATPLRKNEPDFNRPDFKRPDLEATEIESEEEITTGDLARAKRPVTETRGPQMIEGNRTQNVMTSPGATDAVHAPRMHEEMAESSKTLDSSPLFPGGELDGLRTRWKEIQTAFVDEPRTAVQQADGLVASAMKRLAEVFADERSRLERQWDRGDQVSTEELRVALQRYRTFFERLLSV